MIDLTIGHGTPLVEYKRCNCCGSKKLKKIILNDQEYEICEDCIKEDNNLKKIYEVGE
jgi:hypothetical protein